jgi:hypothetical protein
LIDSSIDPLLENSVMGCGDSKPEDHQGNNALVTGKDIQSVSYKYTVSFCLSFSFCRLLLLGLMQFMDLALEMIHLHNGSRFHGPRFYSTSLALFVALLCSTF